MEFLAISTGFPCLYWAWFLKNDVVLAEVFELQLFQRASYKAKDRTDILAAMDEFLEASTVLPPGEWDPNIRIEPPAQVQSQESRLMDKLNRENSVDALQILAGSNIGKPEHGAGIHRTGRLVCVIHMCVFYS